MKRLFLRQLHWHRQNGIDQIPVFSPLAKGDFYHRRCQSAPPNESNRLFTDCYSNGVIDAV